MVLQKYKTEVIPIGYIVFIIFEPFLQIISVDKLVLIANIFK